MKVKLQIQLDKRTLDHTFTQETQMQVDVGKMDEYQHLLYFEANELEKTDSGKIWRYFQKKQASGGGDCLMIRKVGEKAYKICFKEKEGKTIPLI